MNVTYHDSGWNGLYARGEWSLMDCRPFFFYFHLGDSRANQSCFKVREEMTSTAGFRRTSQDEGIMR